MYPRLRGYQRRALAEPIIWTGLAPPGPVWAALLGTPKDLADAFLAYKQSA